MVRLISLAIWASCLITFPIVAASEVVYRITDVGDLPGGDDFSFPAAINSVGAVVGTSNSGSDARPFLWTARDGLQDVGTLIGQPVRLVNDINNAGAVAGAVSVFFPDYGGNRDVAFRWDPIDGFQLLSDLVTRAVAINNSGEVFGLLTYEDTFDYFYFFVWDPTNGFRLRPENEFDAADLNETNDAGQTVGNFENDFGDSPPRCSTSESGCAFLNDPTNGFQLIDGLSADPFAFTSAEGINELGEIVGYSQCDSAEGQLEECAFIWDKIAGIRRLGTTSWIAKAINDRSVVVGSDQQGRATLYEGGITVDLNDRVDVSDPLRAFVTLTSAEAINKRGDIAAAGVDSRTGATHAYVLTAVVPPFSLTPGKRLYGQHALDFKSPHTTFALRNLGTTSLPIIEVAITGSDVSQFLLNHSHGCGPSVPVAGSCQINVKFKPTSTGLKTANLSIDVGNPSLAKAAPLSGTGVQSQYSVSPVSLEFGNRARGTASPAKIVKVTNTGTVLLPITSIGISGPSAGQFKLTEDCPAAKVKVNMSCNIRVVFKPTSIGTKSATLVFTPGGGAEPKSVVLSGTGT